MDTRDQFIKQIEENLKGNGFPERKVSLPLEKMYEIADSKGLSFNDVLKVMKEKHGIESLLETERVIFSSAKKGSASQSAPFSFNPEELKNTDNIIKGLGAVAKMGQKTARQMANIQYGLAIIDAIRAGMATRKNLADDGFSFPIPQIAGALETAAMVAIATQIRAQQFEQGGLVGGRRHSQGGTLIEAERGEFVMSRNAVQSIGVDNLEAMNQGGSAVNITITGNVMTSDFVEGELAEKIRDAVRTGTDFGMS